MGNQTSEDLKEKVKKGLAQRHAKCRRVKPNPPPRYDDVFFEGLKMFEENMESVRIHPRDDITVVVHISAYVDYESENHVKIVVDTGYVVSMGDCIKNGHRRSDVMMKKPTNPEEE